MDNFQPWIRSEESFDFAPSQISVEELVENSIIQQQFSFQRQGKQVDKSFEKRQQNILDEQFGLLNQREVSSESPSQQSDSEDELPRGQTKQQKREQTNTQKKFKIDQVILENVRKVILQYLPGFQPILSVLLEQLKQKQTISSFFNLLKPKSKSDKSTQTQQQNYPSTQRQPEKGRNQQIQKLKNAIRKRKQSQSNQNTIPSQDVRIRVLQSSRQQQTMPKIEEKKIAESVISPAQKQTTYAVNKPKLLKRFIPQQKINIWSRMKSYCNQNMQVPAQIRALGTKSHNQWFLLLGICHQICGMALDDLQMNPFQIIQTRIGFFVKNEQKIKQSKSNMKGQNSSSSVDQSGQKMMRLMQFLRNLFESEKNLKRCKQNMDLLVEYFYKEGVHKLADFWKVSAGILIRKYIEFAKQVSDSGLISLEITKLSKLIAHVQGKRMHQRNEFQKSEILCLFDINQILKQQFHILI